MDVILEIVSRSLDGIQYTITYNWGLLISNFITSVPFLFFSFKVHAYAMEKRMKRQIEIQVAQEVRKQTAPIKASNEALLMSISTLSSIASDANVMAFLRRGPVYDAKLASLFEIVSMLAFHVSDFETTSKRLYQRRVHHKSVKRGRRNKKRPRDWI